MSDFVSHFWSWFIAITTVLSIIACVLMLKSTSKRKLKDQPVETTGHTWDGDLTEYNNPLPRWWMGLFLLTLIFSLAYLALYPGLGNLPGLLGWSSQAAYANEKAQLEKQVQPLFAQYLTQNITTIAADARARAMGERLFLNYCAQCHGSDAGGGKGFPSLRDSDWLYGGSPDAIKESILNGRNGVMPPFAAALGDEGVKNVTQYVRSLSMLSHDIQKARLGQALFMTNCSACHGQDGKGNQALGAPNLTDQVWLLGSSEKIIAETIAKGRGLNNQGVLAMPAHKDIIDEAKVHVLAAYVWSLSNQWSQQSP